MRETVYRVRNLRQQSAGSRKKMARNAILPHHGPGLAAPTAPDVNSCFLLPAAQFPDLGNRLSRQHDRIAFTAYSDEDIREGHCRPVHPNVPCFVTRIHLLSAHTACSRCYVALVPWCLHNASLFNSPAHLSPSATLDMTTLRMVCPFVSKSPVFTNPLHAADKTAASAVSA